MPHEISDFEEELDEDVDGYKYREEEKDNDTNDEGIKDTLKCSIPEGVALKTK